MDAPFALEMRDISKRYPGGTLANADVSLDVAAAGVHAIVGENGAGKSTLMKILYGIEQPDSGAILLDGTPVQISSPARAIALGIGMVFQHFSLVPSLSVAENVVLGAEPRRGLVLDLPAALRSVGELAERFGLPVDPAATVGTIPVGQQQRVEILKALYRNAQILILDEPTAVLTPQEVAELFTAIRGLVARGRTVLFIAHKLPEVLAISDAITVMRGGRVVGNLRTADATAEELTRLMVGRDVSLQVARTSHAVGPVVCAIEGVSANNSAQLPAVNDVSFVVRSGEILGIAAVEGNGQSELLEVLSGLRQPTAGRITLGAEDVTGWSVRHLRQAGVASIPEDRLARGLAAEATIAENMVAERIDRPPLVNRGILDWSAIRRAATELVNAYGVRTSSVQVPVDTLSGGNMQKVVIARELSSQPKLLLAAQPTRGIDIGATEFVWQSLIQARNRGAAIILTSADLTELLALADRIIVLSKGRLVAAFPDPANLTPEDLGTYMLGAREQPAAERAMAS
ncbi:MAG: ABC transporter ATP-binding protein [Chloroflexia bacterium]|nr:ABC transporter ATP-binding protein [Chloroflexia bacterium]